MLNIAEKEKLRKESPYLYETIVQIENAINSLARQTATDPAGVQAAPKPISSISVTVNNTGLANVQIIDDFAVNAPASVSRTLRYFIEAATDPGFVNVVHTEYTPARNVNIQLGAQTLYFRAYSVFQSGRASIPVAFGGNTPTAVVVGGSVPPVQQPYQGTGSSTTSGTGYGLPIRAPDILRIL